MNMEVDSPVLENVSAEVMATSASNVEPVEAAEGDPQPVQDESKVTDDAGSEARVNGNSAETETASANSNASVSGSAELKSPTKGDAPKQLKRRASRSPSLEGEEFRGFTEEESIQEKASVYTSIVNLISAEVKDKEAKFTPLQRVAASHAVKRVRTEEGSRPSSPSSHRSDGDFAASSPVSGRGRRVASDLLSLPQYRVPFDHGWKRELVHRATLDPHLRRNADIYYYTPAGKKLRSSREVAEHLAGTGLTLDNFTFFKEALGLDDPEKEIIRDAKQRDSPAASPATPPTPVEGKRVPKPKAPKGASPIHSPSVTSLKLKVKSQGSRISRGSIGEKTSAASSPSTPPVKKLRLAVPPPPPLLSRPAPPPPADQSQGKPCSMSCPEALNQVPSLACFVCLCLYHPACAGHTGPVSDHFLCKNCKVSSGPPPLTHKPLSAPPPLTPSPRVLIRPLPRPPPPLRRYPVPRPVAVRRLHSTPPVLVARKAAPPPAPPTPAAPRVFLRMKAAATQGGTGERIWAVQPPPPSPTPAPARSPQAAPKIALPAPAKVVLPTTVAAASASKATVSVGPVRAVAPTRMSLSKCAPPPRIPSAAAPPRAKVASPQRAVRGAAPTHVRPARGQTVVQTVAVINGRKYILVPKHQVQARTQ